MKSLFLSVLLCLFFSVILFAQESNTFDKDGLKFNYPAGWTITDKSTIDIQTLFISKENSSVLIIISSPRENVVSSEQYSNFQSDAHSKYIKAISKSLSTSEKKAEEEWLCLDFNGRKVSGTKYTGSYNNESAIGEVYPFVLGYRFITLVYMRTDKDSPVSDVVWKELIKSLYLNNSNKDAKSAFLQSDSIEGGIMNGKALKLVRPTYSKMEYQAGAKGTVEVEVEIDETGKVIYSKAISGHKLLYKSAEYAAKKSKFSPTRVCDKGIKVRGTIVYNFAP